MRTRHARLCKTLRVLLTLKSAMADFRTPFGPPDSTAHTPPQPIRSFQSLIHCQSTR